MLQDLATQSMVDTEESMDEHTSNAAIVHLQQLAAAAAASNMCLHQHQMRGSWPRSATCQSIWTWQTFLS